MRAVIVLLLVLAVAACGRIETGMVGVRTEINKSINTAELAPGFYVAVLTSVDEYTVKEIEIKLDNLTPKGKDNLSLADFDVSIWYQPNPAEVAEKLIKYQGMSPCEHGICYPVYNLIQRVAQSVVFDVVSRYESLTLHLKRTEIEAAIKQLLQEEMDQRDKNMFIITRVAVRQIKTDPTLEKSIQAAVQMQKQVEAKDKEVDLAKAEARRIVAEADGQGKANKVLSDSLTDQFLKYKQLEVMSQFAGKGTHTVIMPAGGGVPLIQVR